MSTAFPSTIDGLLVPASRTPALRALRSLSSGKAVIVSVRAVAGSSIVVRSACAALTIAVSNGSLRSAAITAPTSSTMVIDGNVPRVRAHDGRVDRAVSFLLLGDIFRTLQFDEVARHRALTKCENSRLPIFARTAKATSRGKFAATVYAGPLKFGSAFDRPWPP